jgi:DNA-binding MarR family transcriptional regulator
MQSIDRLEDQGYLQRLRRVGDRRSYSLQLTERGQEVLAAINTFLPARDQDLLSDLNADEVKQLARLLTKVIGRGHQRLKDLQSAAPDNDAAPKARLAAKGG